LDAGAALTGNGFWALAPGKAELKHMPMEVRWANSSEAFWTPDGKAFAHSAEVHGVRQVFVRYLDATAPVQLTRLGTSATAPGVVIR